jgi:hypothetical protein
VIIEKKEKIEIFHRTKRLSFKRTMKMQKFQRLAAIVIVLIMIVKPAFGMAIDDEHHLPDAPKSEAQMYFDQIPVESKLKRFAVVVVHGSYVKFEFEIEVNGKSLSK